MASEDIEKYRENAEIYHGHEVCKQKIKEIEKELKAPPGLRLKDIIELGYHRQSGFMWVRQKETVEHNFKKIGSRTSYDPLITCFIELHKISKMTGVKTRQFMIWISISEMYIDKDHPDEVHCKTAGGFKRTFPVSGFEDEEEEEEEEKKKKEEKK